ncbi:MAG: DUF6141 family protein [Methanomassiliicoccales archaeon]|jgi:hypothetical protein|nr:DUF6141 family protein [Methanomassiliicoccales archaeon]
MSGILEEGVIFREVQRLRQPWVLAIVFGITLATWAMAFYQLVLGVPVGNNPAEDWLMVVILLLVGVLFPAFILSVRLIVEVRRDGLFLRYRPFHHRFVDLKLETVVSVQALTYRPLRDFGGWGIRYGRGGTAYSMSGKEGVQLTYPKNRHIMIGSLRAQELEMAIRSAMRK